MVRSFELWFAPLHRGSLGVEYFLSLHQFLLEVLNRFGKEQDEPHPENVVATDDMLVRDFGATRLNVGKHVAGDVHALALQFRHERFLRPTPLRAQSSDGLSDEVEAAHTNPCP